MSVLDFLQKEFLYFDGAMGTRLQAAGLKPGELPEAWNITHGDVVAEIHASYVRAGANILKSNTFGANALKMQGSGYSVEEVVLAAFENARKAFASVPEMPAEKKFTALDLGPTGKLLAPYGDLQFEEAVALYAEIVRAGVKAKADLVLVETMSDTYEAKAAILAAKENSDLPVFVTFTFDKDGKLLNGADVETAVLMAEGLGVDAVGFNCGLGPDLVAKLMPRARRVTELPLIANPNAGLPTEQNGKTVFTTGPEEFADYMLDVYREGASVLGGCCGTDPHYIRLVAERTKDLIPVVPEQFGVTAVTGYGVPVFFGKEPVLIGERINPTGKPLLKEALRNGDVDYVCRLGLEQLDNGAHILDVNTGLPGLNETDTLCKAVTGLQAITPVPLEIDTSNYEAMEKALRLYNGKPLLNSVNGKPESMEKVFPLAKKYGAAVVGLCLDESGIPDTAEGRLAIADNIIQTAAEYGIKKKDIIIDPLALTVSTDSRNPSIDLAVIKALKSKGIHTVMGVSNISFGLPNRDAVNSAFFAMSLAAGLSSAIMNPQSERMMEAYRAYCALSGADEGCKEYVARYANAPKTKTTVAVSEYTLYDAIVKGLTEQSGSAAKKLLEENKTPLEIINGFIIPALNTVGEGFGKKTLFLPQLLMAADAAKAAFDELKKQMQNGAQSNEAQGDTIVLAVVKGDIHDIGKNIVKVLWENYGYHVVDLGKDVPAEAVVEAVEKHQARLVGLTALMTTTVAAMEDTINALRRKTDTKILVGGAVMTQEYAGTIGADGYAPDAVAAVDYANRIFKR
ncbi:MAG: homocysteine S-methyltransferase family protein [Acidaminococcaceae bacterium]|nr:homocysteine S-methyltransferase family protein [Acidaminococcaceae bacterium]